MEEKKVPALRFRGFDNAWEQRRAKDIFVAFADKGYPELPVLSATQDRGMIRRDENSINIHHDKKNEEGYKRVLPGQFVIHLRSFQGGFAHSTIEGITSPAYIVFGFAESKDHCSEYWKYIFISETFIKRLETVTYGIRDGRSISYDEFLTLSFVIPYQEEQIRIAQYLKKLDHLISLHQRKLEMLKKVKKSMLEKMFPKNDAKVPEVRFSDFTDAWEQRRLGELADKVTEKNTLLAKTEVLTNSAEFGIINQREFFDHDIVNENNIGGYYIVRERDFVYNPRISVSAPVGPINCNKLGKSGVMSPLYTVFRVHDIDSIYLEYFFKTSRWHSFMRFNGDSGVRSDRFSIKTELFYKMPIPITKYCEQVKIGKYFSQLDNLISLHQRKLEKLKNIKKSMLEKMFII